jgi:hypothetical protein
VKEEWNRVASGSKIEQLLDRFCPKAKEERRKYARRDLADKAVGDGLNTYVDPSDPSRHHKGCDFDAAVRDAFRLVRTVRPWAEEHVYGVVNPTRMEPLDPQTRLMWSLINDPITWDGSQQVSNGQHRLAGARAAGIAELLVRKVS